MSDIGNELTQSLDRNGKGAMLAQLQLASGAVGAPALSFSAEPTSGLYRAGAGDLRFAIAGVDKFRVGASGLTLTSALLAQDGALATPGIAFASEAGAGLYRAGSNDVRLAINNKDIARATTKLSVSAATAATGGTRQDALALTNGDLDLSAVAYPTSTTAIANRLTPMNILKALAIITVNGTTTPFTVTVDAGFNITSVARASASTFTFTFASAFANTSYGAIGQAINAFVAPDMILFNPTTRNVGSMVAGLVKSSGGGVTIDGWGNTIQLCVTFYGAQ
ncbi:MAG TPA: hypothetical protein VFP50_15445 [Anaeromyxobacteraceae bacterium]|nr:hypothetical protein [Anaeromyxobacteraceae bacterium]